MQDVDALFAELQPLLARHASSLAITRDEPGDFQLESSRSGPSGTGMWFGAVQSRDDHVRFHLMAVYSHPDLLGGVSDQLRARMRGKGCFSFTPDSATPELLGELSQLVGQALERYRADGLA